MNELGKALPLADAPTTATVLGEINGANNSRID